MEQLFNEMVRKDLARLNKLVADKNFDTTDFNEAVLTLSNSLAMYHQEVTFESCTKGERIQESWLDKGA